MIDHILLYANDIDREGDWPTPEDASPSWTDGDRSIMPTRVVISRAIYDDNGEEVSAEVLAPGSYLVIRTPYRDAELEAMDECIIVTDAELMASGLPYVIKCTLLPETILGQVDPVWAGSPYAIPVGSPASDLDNWRI